MTSLSASDQRISIMGWLTVCLALYPATHIISSAFDHPVAVTILQALLRYGLVAAIGLLARPVAVKVLVVVLSLSFLVIDVLAATGLFSVYAAVRPEPEPFIYFQF